jgi:RNA polymerase sigma-70 factor (ECF subfamily)
VLTLPKTIDNDVAQTDVSFGFDSAMAIATEAIDRLHTTATSPHRIIVLDITQEAFIKAYRALPRFRGDSAFYTWLYRIAVNTAKNHLAAQRRRPMDIELDLQDPEQYDLHARLKDTDTPEALSISREMKETVEQAIQSLPDDLRTAIILRELDGMSYEEIAETMECPVGTVRSRIFRARDAISKKVGSLIR